jgi:hypothetical protein
MKKYTIKQLKDKEIWVKCTGEDAKKFITSTIDADLAWRCKYYRFEKRESGKLIYNFSDTEPEMYIEFSQVDFEERKIIGYKTPMAFYGGKIPKGSFISIDNILNLDGDYWFKNTDITMVLPIELIENIFEPVYEEEKLMLGEFEVVEEKGTMGIYVNAGGLSLNKTLIEKILKVLKSGATEKQFEKVLEKIK